MIKNISTYILTSLASLIFIMGFFQGNTHAATGRNGNYSNFSAHGGFALDGGGDTRGVLRTETDNAGYARGNCAHCHEQHASIEGASEKTPNEHMLFDTLVGNALCNTCHNGSQIYADNIAFQIGKLYRHDPLVDLGSRNAGAAPPKKPICSECHNSHEARPTSHNEAVDGNAVTGGPLFSVAEEPVYGLPIINWGGATSPAVGTEAFSTINYPTEAIVTEEWQLCLRCHSQLAPANPNIGKDVADLINPNNHAVHPIVAKSGSNWNNAFLRINFATAFKAPWNGAADRLMYCSDCHGAEDADSPGTGPQGPHGSNNEFLLKKIGPGAPAILDDLCLRCHDPFSTTGSSAFVDTWGSATVGDHNFPGHQAPANPDGCMACHSGIANTTTGNRSDIHGANYTWPDPNGVGALGAQFFISPGGNRGAAPVVTGNYKDAAGAKYCTTAPGCHTNASRTYQYK